MIRFCPHCSAPLTWFVDGQRVRQRCPECDYVLYKNPTVGVAVIIIERGRILLAQRRCGRWCIPCGHVEWDETIESAARRELKEETGLDCELIRVVDVRSNFHNPTNHTVGVWYLGRRTGGMLNSGDDATAVAFWPGTALPELAFPTDVSVLSGLRTGSTEASEVHFREDRQLE